VANILAVWSIPALFWIAGGTYCLLIRRSRWGAPIWTLVATPAMAFLLLIGWILFRSRGGPVQAINGPAPGLLLFALSFPLSLLALLVVASCPPPRYWRTPTAWLCVPAFIAAIALSVGFAYEQSDAHIPTPTVKLIVPNGFSGPFWVREDPDYGVPPAEVDGMTHYLIPDSGRLTTTNIGPLWNAQRFSAAFADGREIPDNYGGKQKGARLWHSGTSYGAHRFFVGTQKELHAHRSTNDLPPEWQELKDAN